MAVLMACGSSIPGRSRDNIGLMQTLKLIEGVQSFECAMAITIDDLLNGNITNDQSNFFTGGIFLNKYLSMLGGNISEIASNLSTSTQNETVMVINSALDVQHSL